MSNKANASNTSTETAVESISDEVLVELTSRVQDIDNSYRAVAQKMGQLYMCADQNQLRSLTQSLDKPMRNASENEQAFAALLQDLRVLANQRQ